MAGKKFRPRLLATLIVALMSGLAVTIAVVPDPVADLRRNCRSAPSPACLADYGVALVRKARISNNYRIVTNLALLGRFEAAEAALGGTVALAVAEDKTIRTQRLVQSVRANPDQLPDWSPLAGIPPLAQVMALHIGALDLAGQNPYGFHKRTIGKLPPGHPVFAAFATRAMALVATLDQTQRNIALRHIATLFALADDSEAARTAIEAHDGARSLTIGPKVVALLGVAEVQSLIFAKGNINFLSAYSLASAAAQADQAPTSIEPILQIALDLAGDEDWPFRALQRVAQLAAKIGLDAVAAEALDQMIALDATGTEIFPWGPAQEIAEIYRLLGREVEARNWLAETEARFPGDPNSVLAVGLVGGAYTFKRLESEARSALAREYFALGDEQSGFRVIEGQIDSEGDANYLLADMEQGPAFDAALKQILAGLAPGERGRALSQVAMQVAFFQGNLDAALPLAANALNEAASTVSPIFSGEVALKIGTEAGDDQIARAGLAAMIDAALASKDSGQSLQAALIWRDVAPDLRP